MPKRKTTALTDDDFRRIALDLPEAGESAHMDHPDFRVRGKVFATLSSPGRGWGMVKLTPDQQRSFVRAEPEVFVPAKGAWGTRGCTHVRLATVDEDTLRGAIEMAWRNTAPKRLVEQFDAGS
jgi:hypothetical protein